MVEASYEQPERPDNRQPLGDAQDPSKPQAAQTKSKHRGSVRILIALATLLSVLAIFAVWANRQLLNTSYWTDTSTQLLESSAIRGELSTYLTDQLYANVDVAGQLQQGLPPRLKPLSNPAAAALRDPVETAIDKILQRPRVQELWRRVNTAAHTQFVKLVENKGDVVKTPGNGSVVLDLRALLINIGQQLGTKGALASKLPPDAAQLTVVDSKSLESMQKAANALRTLAVVLPILAFLLYGLAVYLAHGRRPRTLAEVGISFAGAGLLVLVARSLIGNKVVDTLATTEAIKPAVSDAWSIATSVLSNVAGATIFIGVLICVAGLIAGVSHWAFAFRKKIAPYLSERPAYAYGVVCGLLLLLFAWGPIVATRTLLGIVAITALTLFGVAMLRRQTAREFPGV